MATLAGSALDSPKGSQRDPSKAEGFAVEYSKVFINLASLFLGLTITFYKQITDLVVADWAQYTIVIAWVLWIISIFCGARALVYLINVSASVERTTTETDGSVTRRKYNLFDTQLTWLLRGQQYSFLLGFIVVTGAPIAGLFADPTTSLVPSP